MDPKLESLTAAPYDRSPRFYPPGQHPATYRYREQLRQLKALQTKVGKIPNVVLAIEYIENKIAEFEERESEAKARMLYHLEREKP